MDELVDFSLAALLVGGITPLLARLSLGAGWVDRRDDPAALARKPRTTPVPLVGGAAIVLGLALMRALGRGPWLPWPALLAAFLVGSVDDRVRGGLKVGVKVVGQVGVASLVAWECAATPLQALAWAAFTLLALNAANTFDNADGALTGLGALAFGGTLAQCGCMLGFLPWNLARRTGRRREVVPVAYLGDAGSHVIGVLLLASPAAWPALALPLLDLARLWRLRRRSGQPPWVGDRRHLAHRLEASGMGRELVVAALVCIAAPACLFPSWVGGGPLETSWWLAVLAGCGATGLLFALALRLTPAGARA